MNSILRTAAFLCAAIAAPAVAHDSWLEPQTFQPRLGAVVPVTLYIGHHGEQRATKLTSTPKWLQSMRRDGRGGTLDLMKTQELTRAGAVRMPSAGTHVISLATAGFKHEMKPSDFPGYMKEEGLAAAQASWARSPITGRNVREEYRRYAKALVRVGPRGSDKIVSRQVGHRLELVPSADPHGIAAGQRLKATVLHQGRPLAGALVTLGSLDRPKDPLAERMSDANGEFSFEMPRSGRWMMNVVWSVPSNTRGVDYETSFSSLTFSAAQRR